MRICHCGEPLHYSDPALEAMVEQMVVALGECVKVTVEGRSWMVPRHYIALHGLKASELPELGFQEVQ